MNEQNGSPTYASTPINQPDFLVQITLHNTHNPVVTRTLSVPYNSWFREMHMGIAASFGWDVPWGTDEAWWTFFVTAGDPLVVQDPNKLTKLAEIIWFTQQRNPKTTKWPVIPAWNTRAFQIFDNGNFRGKPLLYGLHRPEIAHTVKNIGRSVDPPGDRVRCIGGQGHITASDWYASLATSAVDGGPSSWALDLGMAKKRLEERWADPNALYWWNVRE